MLARVTLLKESNYINHATRELEAQMFMVAEEAVELAHAVLKWRKA